MAWWGNITGTVTGYLRLGLSGVRIKNDAGELAVRDAADGAFAKLQIADGTAAGHAVSRGQLAASGGSGLVGFLQFGTGAVTRTTQTKLREIINVKDFGAVGDGVANDAAAINNALTAAASSGMGVYAPAGTYLIGAQLVIPDGVIFIGAGKGKTEIKASASFNTVALGNRSVLENMTINGNGQASSSTVFIDTKTYARVKGVRSIGATFHGFALPNSTYCRLEDIESEDSGNRGLLLDPNCAYNHISGYHAKNCGSGGLLIGHNSRHNQVDGFTIEGSPEAQVWIHNEAYLNIVKNGTIRAPGVGGATKPGLILAANAYRNILTNITIEGHNEGVLVRGSVVDTGYTAGNTRQNILSDILIIGPGSGTVDSVGVKFDSLDTGTTRCPDNSLNNVKIIGFQDGVRDFSANSMEGNVFSALDASVDVTNKFVYAAGFINRVHAFKGYTPTGFQSSPPAVAASGTAVSNPYPFPVMVAVLGLPADGNVHINGVGVAPTAAPNGGNGGWVLSQGQTITLIYPSGTPTWRWFGI